MDKKKLDKWYDNGYIICGLIILVILLILLCSQSFVNGELSFALFSSVINSNSIYLLILIYFVLLLFPVGKKYFNYLSLFLLIVYFLVTVTSLLTVFQSFKLVTVLKLILNFVLFMYAFHTLLRGTRFWKELHLSSSPFHELTNEGIFYAIIVLSVFLLIVNLINAVEKRGIIMSLLDTSYFLLFGRYIHLYFNYLDMKKIDSNNEGNFNDFKSNVQEVLDKTEVDDVIVQSFKDVKEVIVKDKKKEEETSPEIKKVKKTKKGE